MLTEKECCHRLSLILLISLKWKGGNSGKNDCVGQIVVVKPCQLAISKIKPLKMYPVKSFGATRSQILYLGLYFC